MELKPGWLNRQFAAVSREVACWPKWMKREGGFMDIPDPRDQRIAELEREQAALKHEAQRFSNPWTVEIQRAFLDTLREHPDIILDHELMVTWFANALMRGYDEYRWNTNEYKRSIRRAIFPWWNWKHWIAV